MAVVKQLDLVVLNPIQWLAQLMALFVRDNEALPIHFDDDGICIFPNCHQVLTDASFSSSRTQSLQIMGLMSKLQLCVDIPSQDTKHARSYLFPSHLKHIEPSRLHCKAWDRLQQLPPSAPSANSRAAASATTASTASMTASTATSTTATTNAATAFTPTPTSTPTTATVLHVVGRRLTGTLQGCAFLPIGFFVNLQCYLKADSLQVEDSSCNVELHRNALLVEHASQHALLCVTFDALHGSLDLVAWGLHSKPTPALLELLHRTVLTPALDLLGSQYPGMSVDLSALCPHCLLAARGYPCPFPLVGGQLGSPVDTAFLQQSRGQCHLEPAELTATMLAQGVVGPVGQECTPKQKQWEELPPKDDTVPRDYVYVCMQRQPMYPELQQLWAGVKGFAGQAAGLRCEGLRGDDVQEHRLRWAWRCRVGLIVLDRTVLKEPSQRLACLRRLRSDAKSI